MIWFKNYYFANRDIMKLWMFVFVVVAGADPLDMEASLTSPSGKSELCEIRDLEGEVFDIKFVPAEEGVHTVSLKHKGLHIAGEKIWSAINTTALISQVGGYRVKYLWWGYSKLPSCSYISFGISFRHSPLQRNPNTVSSLKVYVG